LGLPEAVRDPGWRIGGRDGQNTTWEIFGIIKERLLLEYLSTVSITNQRKRQLTISKTWGLKQIDFCHISCAYGVCNSAEITSSILLAKTSVIVS